MNIGKARSLVTSVWFVGALVFYSILVIQSLENVYAGDTEKVWAWALPTMMPTLLLMMGVHAGEALNTAKDRRTVVPYFFFLAITTSGFYVVVVLLTLLLVPVIRNVSPLALMERSSLWLGPLQGLAAGVFGVFYVHKKK